MGTTVGRATATYASDDDKYSLANKMHGQYFQLYYDRLMTLAPRVDEARRDAWADVPRRGVLELREGETCVVVGTVYKDMKDKPIILDEYAKDFNREEETRRARETYTREDDRLEFEDEGARVKLVGVDAGRLVTGVVCACKGKAVNGDFEVEDVFVYARARGDGASGAGKSGAEETRAGGGGGKYVCLVSGFEIGKDGDGDDDESAAARARAQMFVDYVTGASMMDDGEACDSDAAKICRVVVAGGTMDLKANGNEETTSGALKELDIMFTELASAVPVDVMSGQTDPTNKAMPQQPLHPVYFPEATRFEKTMRLVTNPHDFTVDHTSFLGTSGQNVQDVLKFSTIDAKDASDTFAGDDAAKSSVAALSQTLRWQRVAPSAPDTLACYPFKDRDPFVIERTPRVYFAGCQSAFGHERVSHAAGETLVVSVPKFSTAGVAVLVDVDTLECRPIHFATCV